MQVKMLSLKTQFIGVVLMSVFLTGVGRNLALAASSQASSANELEIPRVLIPEILQLDYEIIPDWVFEKYDTQTIAENLVYRLRLNIEKKQGRLIRPKEHSDIQLWFGEDQIERIVTSGEFLNVHQSHGSRSRSYLNRRFSVELSALDVYLENYKRRKTPSPERIKLFPKYAILDISIERRLGEQYFSGDAYGDFAAVFSEKVKRRTTWTGNDSLVGGFYPQHLEKGYIDPKSSGQYIEAQIWGELILSDVAYFMIPENVDPAILKKLKQTAKPIYTWKKIDSFFGRVRNVPNQQIYDPPSCSKVF